MNIPYFFFSLAPEASFKPENELQSRLKWLPAAESFSDVDTDIEVV